MQALPLQKTIVLPDRRNPHRAEYRRFVELIKACRIDRDYPPSLFEARRAGFICQISRVNQAR